MSSKDNGGWIRHRGGKCPVDGEAKVEVRQRGGDIRAENAQDFWWEHRGNNGDIMSYRIHRPHVATVKECLTVEQANQRVFDDCVDKCASTEPGETEMPTAKYFDGPLQWRDRIHAIDAEQKAADEAHKAATDARTAERAELVQKLAGEGLALLWQQETPGPAEDMSDWRNWKAGDLLEMIDADLWSVMTNGKLYALLEPCDDQVFRVVDDMGDVHEFDELQMQCSASPALDFKWHSRPSK